MTDDEKLREIIRNRIAYHCDERKNDYRLGKACVEPFIEDIIKDVGNQQKKQATNAARIRGMTDGELQKFLCEFESGDVDYAKTFCDLCCKDAALERRSVDCEGCLLWWLKNDAKQPQGLDYWTKQPAETEE